MAIKFIESRKELVEAIELLADLRAQMEELKQRDWDLTFGISTAVRAGELLKVKPRQRELRFRSGRHIVAVRDGAGGDRVHIYSLGTEAELRLDDAAEAG